MNGEKGCSLGFKIIVCFWNKKLEGTFLEVKTYSCCVLGRGTALFVSTQLNASPSPTPFPFLIQLGDASFLFSYIRIFVLLFAIYFLSLKLQTIVYFIAISYRGLGRFCLILPVIFPLLEFCLQALTSNLGYCFLNYFLLKKHVEIGMIHRFCLTST